MPSFIAARSRPFRPFTAGALLLVLSGTLSAIAQDAFAPTYSRTRMGAHDFHRRGDGHGFGGRRGGGYGNFYFDPYFSSPVIYGSYYQRPYPYHFDYYRHRWGAPPADAAYSGYPPDPGSAASDCPCADPPPLEVVE
jgi:hypothetical protein